MADDYMKKLMAELTPPIPGLKLPDKRKAEGSGAGTVSDGEDDDDITDDALDEAEHSETMEDEDDEDLGVFDEAQYAPRIAGYEFKSRELYVDPPGIAIKGYYRRRWNAADPGAPWERIGHSRGANALELRRLLYCAEQRDARARQKDERRALIESLFGAGSVPLVESLIAAGRSEAASAVTLTPRQEAFCRHYLTEPSGTRAAIMAGYAESGAGQEAHRLLKNADILQKISSLRRAHAISYALDRDTMLDKLEAFFEDAMRGQSYSAALRALLAQAELSGIMNRRHKATERAEARAHAAVEANGTGASQPPERER